MKNFKFKSLSSLQRYAATLLVLLTLFSSHAWAYRIKDAKIYYDDLKSQWGTNVVIAFGKGNDDTGGGRGGSVYAIEHIDNTKLYYWSGSWGEDYQNWVSELRFGQTTKTYDWYNWWYKNEGEQVRNTWQLYQTDLWSGVSGNYCTSVYEETVLFESSGTGAGDAITKDDISTFPDDMNNTQNVYYSVREGAGAYTAALNSGSTPAKLHMTSYKFVSGTYNAVSAESPSDLAAGGTTYTRSFTAARTATTQITVSNIANGYEFEGWYDAATGGNQLANASTTTYTYYPTGACNVYARFRKITYSLAGANFTTSGINWNAGTVASGGTKLMTTSDGITYTVTLSGETLGASTRAFKLIKNQAWDTNAISYSKDGLTKTYYNAILNKDDDDNFTLSPYIAGTITITYNTSSNVIVITCESPTITFNKAGGEDGTDSQKTNTNTATSSIEIPEKDGYNFTGYWSDDATPIQVINSSGAWIANKSGYTDNSSPCKWTVSADHTFTAHWTEITHSVTVANDGNGTTNVNSVSGIGIATASSTITAIPTFGYRFSSWTIPSGVTIASGSTTNPSITIKATADSKTITANFVREYMYIEGAMTIYNESRGSATSTTWSDETSTAIQMEYDGTNHCFYLHTYNTVSNLKGAGDVNYFYFKASTSSSALSNVVTIGAYSNNASYKDLTAAGSGKQGGRDKTNTFQLKPSTPEDGYAILYLYEVAGNIYLKYELECALSYYKGHEDATGDNPAARTYYPFGEDQTAETNTYSRTGYTFSKWKTAADEEYDEGDTNVDMNAAEVCLSAQWTANPYTVTLHNNDATTAGAASVSVTYDAAVGNIASNKPAKTGYTFAGYYDNEDLTGSPIIKTDGYFDWNCSYVNTSTGAWEHDDDLDLYARWTPNTLTFRATSTDKWDNTANWSEACLPTIKHNVIIDKPVVVNITTAKAKSVKIYNDGDTHTGKLTIGAGKKLVVAEDIQMTANGSVMKATTANVLQIESDGSSGVGALVWGTASSSPGEATVNFYSLSGGSKGSEASVNQFIGTPFTKETSDWLYNYYNSWVLGVNYSESSPAFYLLGSDDQMEPFKGYCVIYNGSTGNTYNMSGTLVTNADHTCSSLSYKGGTAANTANENLLANPWLAPIKINAMQVGDFTNADATIYIFNSTSSSASKDGLGNYSTYPIGAADGNVIPAMQSFSVFTSDDDGSVALDYSKIVYDPAVAGITPAANKAPMRVAEEEANKLRMYVNAESGYGDMVYMWERSDFNEGFENGWDGHKIAGDKEAPQFYAITPDGNMAVNCVPDFEGTVMGFKAGTEDNEYTFTFDYEGEQVWYLNDLEAQQSTLIDAESSYNFSAVPGTVAEHRFVISHTPIAHVPTGIDNSEAVEGVTARKLMINGMMYIIRDGQIYSTDGQMVK